MPVLVNGADAPLGRRLVTRLLSEGGEVRARVPGSGPTAALRRGGAHVAVGPRDDVGLLEAALEQVHTVVHVGGGLLSPSAEAVDAGTRAVVEAASAAGVRRVIALSVAGARVDAGDPLRRAKARTERDLREAPPPSVVVRLSLVDTPGVRDALAGLDPGPDLLERPVAPVRLDDVVALLVALDAARSRATGGHVAFAADGPTTMPLAAYLETSGIGLPGEDARRVGRRYVPPGSAPLLAEALDGPWVNRDEVLLDAWDFADVSPGEIDDQHP